MFRGLHYLHNTGVAHRDVKPDNLFIEEIRGKPNLCVGDFGLACFINNDAGGLNPKRSAFKVDKNYFAAPEIVSYDWLTN